MPLGDFRSAKSAKRAKRSAGIAAWAASRISSSKACGVSVLLSGSCSSWSSSSSCSSSWLWSSGGVSGVGGGSWSTGSCSFSGFSSDSDGISSSSGGALCGIRVARGDRTKAIARCKCMLLTLSSPSKAAKHFAVFIAKLRARIDITPNCSATPTKASRLSSLTVTLEKFSRASWSDWLSGTKSSSVSGKSLQPRISRFNKKATLCRIFSLGCSSSSMPSSRATTPKWLSILRLWPSRSIAINPLSKTLTTFATAPTSTLSAIGMSNNCWSHWASSPCLRTALPVRNVWSRSIPPIRFSSEIPSGILRRGRRIPPNWATVLRYANQRSLTGPERARKITPPKPCGLITKSWATWSARNQVSTLALLLISCVCSGFSKRQYLLIQLLTFFWEQLFYSSFDSDARTRVI